MPGGIIRVELQSSVKEEYLGSNRFRLIVQLRKLQIQKEYCQQDLNLKLNVVCSLKNKTSLHFSVLYH